MVNPHRVKKSMKEESASLHSIRTSRSTNRELEEDCRSYNECPDGSEMSGDSDYAEPFLGDEGGKKNGQAPAAFIDLNQLDQQQMEQFIRGLGYEKKTVIPPPTTICNLVVGAVLGISLFVLFTAFFGNPICTRPEPAVQPAAPTPTPQPILRLNDSMDHVDRRFNRRRRRRSLSSMSTDYSRCDVTQLLEELEQLRAETGVTVGSVRDRLRELCDNPPSYARVATTTADETIFFSANSTAAPADESTMALEASSPPQITNTTTMAVAVDDDNASTASDFSTIKAPSDDEFPETNNTAINSTVVVVQEMDQNGTSAINYTVTTVDDVVFNVNDTDTDFNSSSAVIPE